MNWVENKANETSEAHIASKAVKDFSLLFFTSLIVDIRRAVRLWNSRHKHDKDYAYGISLCICGNTPSGVKQVRLKTAAGNGQKRAKWAGALHEELCDEFGGCCCVGIRCSMNTLWLLGLLIFDQSENVFDGKGLVAASIR